MDISGNSKKDCVVPVSAENESLEEHLEKDLSLKKQYALDISGNSKKDSVVPVSAHGFKTSVRSKNITQNAELFPFCQRRSAAKPINGFKAFARVFIAPIKVLSIPKTELPMRF